VRTLNIGVLQQKGTVSFASKSKKTIEETY